LKISCDCHIHTLASGHAYSTIDECARAAAEKKLELIALTDHAPTMPGAAHIFFFENLKILPPVMHGVEVLHGIEANIAGFDGSLDVYDELLGRLGFVIASMHVPCIKPGTRKENTDAVLGAMKNPHVCAIGHPDDSRYEYDYAEMARAAADTHTLIEVNNSSLLPTSFRKGAREAYLELLGECAKAGASLIVNSDAHYHGLIGGHDAALSLLAETGFDESGVMNTSSFKLKEFLARG